MFWIQETGQWEEACPRYGEEGETPDHYFPHATYHVTVHLIFGLGNFSTSTPPPNRVSETQLIIKWFQKAIDAVMENRKFQSLWKALKEVQDDVKGGNLAAFGLMLQHILE